MKIIEVNDKESLDRFHELPGMIYRNDPNYVEVLRPLIENGFNRNTNAALAGGHACRWIVVNNNQTVGRIGAFIVRNYTSSYDQPTGGIGFFECIDDQQVANLLFDASRDFLSQNGMEAMDGPINPGENFFNWGLHIHGDMQQTFGMQYHKPYYRKLFDTYGFQTFYEQYSYRLDIASRYLPERFWKIAAWVHQKPGYTYEQFTFRNQDKYIADFINIHEKAWSHHANYKRIDPEEIRTLLKDAKPFLVEEFIWYAYRDGEPAAFFMMIPDMNQVIRRLKGNRLNLANLVRLFLYNRPKAINRARVIVMGVVPKYQKSGLESAIFYQLKEMMESKPWYRDVEISWVGDFNPKMISILEAAGAGHVITHLTLRYLFDRTRKFKRAPIIKD